MTTETMETYARAFHTLIEPGVVMLGRDSRPSGEFLLEAFMEELLRLGRDVIVCGIVPTPTVQFMVEHTQAAGGVIITASHNPIEWNGLKFVRADGTFFLPDECEQLFSIVDEASVPSSASTPGLSLPDQNSILKHVIHVLSLSCIDLNAIQQRHFKVVVDAVNGAGAEALPTLLENMGCEVIRLNCEPSGEFTRGTEPLPENLTDLCRTVINSDADVGCAVDPDADRLALVSEKGNPLGEEYTLVLAAEGYMKKLGTKETFVINLSTSLALEKTAEKYGCRVERSAVGEINVVQQMLALGVNLGGEGNGGVILKEAHLGRDSLVAAAMILNRMSQDEKPLSEIHIALPQFKIVKDKVNLEGLQIEKVLQRVKNSFGESEVNTVDGLKFSWDDRWVHLRKSNTEPIMRIYAEGPSETVARELVDQVISLLK